MNHETTRRIGEDAASRAAGRRRFVRHFGEMLLAMVVGMVALGGASQLLLAAAGSGLSDAPATVRVLLMGFDMTVPMVAWMAYRGHAHMRTLEMAASMIAPTLAAAALAAAGALSTGAALAVQHAVMIPAMLAVMLWRYDHYSRVHARHE